MNACGRRAVTLRYTGVFGLLALLLTTLCGAAPLGGRLGLRHEHDTAVDHRTGGSLRLERTWEQDATSLHAAVDMDLAGGDLGSPGRAIAGTRALLNAEHRFLDSDRRRAGVRLDRLVLQTEAGQWRLRAGRDALSFGQGLVYAPLDFFAPFAPVQIDTDYKTGVDLFELTRVFRGGAELRAVTVGRRGDDGGPRLDAGSWALYGKTAVGRVEVSAAAGHHFAEGFGSFGLSIPVGLALARLDLLVSETDAGPVVSGIVNVDGSLPLGERQLWLFAEAYHNGFGSDALDEGLAGLAARAPALVERAGRGELYALGRNQLAFGASIDLHPLVTQTLLLLHAPDDGSSLLQAAWRWTPDDHRLIDVSLRLPLGPVGSEFGGLRTAPGATTTLGGHAGLLVRYARYF